MKKVLCFGDSNLLGFIPSSGQHYDKTIRWSGVLKKLCGNDYEIIEEGCNNRTGFCDNPAGKNQTGYKILPELLKKDYDYVIAAVGTNDLQFEYKASLEDFETGLENIVDIINKKSPHAKVILAAPSRISDNIFRGYFSTMFNETSIEKSKYLARIYEKVAKEKNCEFIDFDKIAQVSELDGLHYEPESHEKIAQALSKLIIE